MTNSIQESSLDSSKTKLCRSNIVYKFIMAASWPVHNAKLRFMSASSEFCELAKAHRNSSQFLTFFDAEGQADLLTAVRAGQTGKVLTLTCR